MAYRRISNPDRKKPTMRRILAAIFCVAAATSAVFPAAADATVSPTYRAYLKKSEGAEHPTATVKVAETEFLCTEDAPFQTSFEVAQSGRYNILFDYVSASSADGDLRFALRIDGALPFDTASKLELPRYYADSGDIRKDALGNEFAPEQEEIVEKHTYRLCDVSSFSSEPCVFYFDAGLHTITVESEGVPFRIYGIRLSGIETIADYVAVSQKYTYSEYKGTALLIEGESAIKKTSPDLGGKSDSTTPNVYPPDAYYQKVNYIGGSNWSDVNDTIYWEIDVPEDGLYQLSFYYRQNYILNGNAYRRLEIDGSIPFAEAAAIAFPYNSAWKLKTVGDAKGNPYLFAMKKGKHILSLAVTLGPLADFCEDLEDTVYDIGNLYRQMVMVMGETPDANRDYNLFGQIPDFEENLTAAEEQLKALIGSYEALSGKRGGSTVSIINAMANAIQSMLKYKYKAQQYKSIYYSNYSSLSAALYDMMNMPLALDTIVLSGENPNSVKGNKTAFSRLVYSIERFIASFVVDYNTLSETETGSEKLTLWVNWGRDQAQALNFLIQSRFTEKTGIAVDLKITNATLVQGILSGNTPDCVLQHTRSEVVNLAMRDALYDLSGFEDYAEVIQRFSVNAMVPYQYKNGVYGLPDTQSFMMMFVRTDIFEELGLSVPSTWGQFIHTVKVLSGNNLETGIPSTTTVASSAGVAAPTVVAGLYQSILLQNGGDLYSKTLDSTNFLSSASVSAFEMYTDFFNTYDCPRTYSFYNRFRTGLMPLGIQDYTMYATLKATAPEINDKWQMFEIPGAEKEDGSIDHTTCGTGTACMILKDTGNEKNAWEFLKWWTSAETQVSYDRALEGILGIAGRIPLSNVNAIGELSWDGDNLQNLKAQWQAVGEFHEIPGSYYINRVLDQAYWNVVVAKENPRDMLYKWGQVADKEIQRKISQYETD